MQFVRRIAGTVTVFHQGAVLIEGDVARDPDQRAVRDVYLGKQAASSPPRVAALSVVRGIEMLEVRSLASGYPEDPVILGVTFEVAAGEFVGILGHNGMGKTTLLQDAGRPAAGDGGQHPL